MNLSILVASHGDQKWRDLAAERAIPSARAVTGAYEVLWEHQADATRAEVRNSLAERASGDWLCFLDADDELHPSFFSRMAQAEEPCRLLVPAVQYVRLGKRQHPMFWPESDLRSGNWMVVGTVIEKSLFHEIGGWKTYMATGVLNEYDDWALWIRATRNGAIPKKVPRAIYVAHIAPTSPHRRASQSQKIAWVEEIRREEWGVAA